MSAYIPSFRSSSHMKDILVFSIYKCLLKPGCKNKENLFAPLFFQHNEIRRTTSVLRHKKKMKDSPLGPQGDSSCLSASGKVATFSTLNVLARNTTKQSKWHEHNGYDVGCIGTLLSTGYARGFHNLWLSESFQKKVTFPSLNE